MIFEYEDILINHEVTLMNAQSHYFYLVNLYVKEGLYDKAWGYLNYLMMNKERLSDKIRFEQCKILKKEKKYEQAMECLVGGYVYKYQYTKNYSSEKFMKEASIIANKLKWEAKKVEYLSYLIEQSFKNNHFGDGRVIESYRKFLNDINASD